MAQTNQPQKPVGDIFREAREARGESLESVHDATKIPLDVLKGIEEGYRVRTLSPFYLKAFKKKYAEYLRINVNRVVDDYHREKLPPPVENKKEEDVEKIVERFENIFTKELQQQILKGAVILVALFFVIRIGGCLTARALHRRGRIQKTAAAVSKPAVRKESSPVRKTRSAKRRSQRTVAAPVGRSPAESAGGAPVVHKISVTVKARVRSWLQVKTDGSVVFQSILEKGAAENWQADKEVEISGRNINQLEFEINGKLLGTLGRHDRKARRVIITQSGMQVKK